MSRFRSAAGHRGTSALRRILLIASVLGVLLFLGFIVSEKTKKPSTSPPFTNTTSANQVVQPTNAEPLKPFVSWQGKVKAVATDGVTFVTVITDPEKQASEERTYTARITSTTTLSLWDLTTPERANAGATPITLADFKEGDTVTVQAETDVSAEGVIIATKLNKIVNP